MLIERKDVGTGESLTWYLDGNVAREATAQARYVIRYERRDREPMILCEGLMTWWNAYHYFTGLGAGFALAARARRTGGSTGST